MTERALTTAAGQLAEDDDEGEQLGLFGQPETAAGVKRAVGKLPPGRPPGARNKRTERTVAFLLSRHRDPREVLLEIAESNVFDLAALLGCKPLAAMQEKRLAAIGVLPYLAARITPDVIDTRQVIHLTINAGDGLGGGPGGGVVHVLDPEQYQEVSGDDPGSL